MFDSRFATFIRNFQQSTGLLKLTKFEEIFEEYESLLTGLAALAIVVNILYWSLYQWWAW